MSRCTKIPQNFRPLSAFPALLENHFLACHQTLVSGTHLSLIAAFKTVELGVDGAFKLLNEARRRATAGLVSDLSHHDFVTTVGRKHGRAIVSRLRRVHSENIRLPGPGSFRRGGID